MCRIVLVLKTRKNEVVGFEEIKNIYNFDIDFKNIMQRYKSTVEDESCIILKNISFIMVTYLRVINYAFLMAL